MTPQQISLVEESFRAVHPIRDAAAAIFYRRLFFHDPASPQIYTLTLLDALPN